MSIADSIVANYEAALTNYGEWIEVRRYTGTGNQFQAAPARARVKGYKPDEIVAGSAIVQGDMMVKLLMKDLITHQFPLPLKESDKVFVRGVEKDIRGVDTNTGRVGDTLVYVAFTAKGSRT